MKKFNFATLALAFFVFASFSACDFITGPKKDYTQLQNNSDRVILMEEFTGHFCGNCPRAHEKSALLKTLYPDNYVSIAVHAGGFARLYGPPFNDSTSYFVIPMGAALEDYYDADQAGFPKGMINLKTFNAKTLHNFADWGTYIGQELLLPPAMGIEITSAFNTGTRVADIEVGVEYFQAGTSFDNLTVVITEDSIIAPQEDYSQNPQAIEEYNHMDLLRLSVTSGTWGEQLKPSAINVGEQFIRNFSVTIPANINPDHCHVIAYINHATTKEVYQAAEEKLK